MGQDEWELAGPAEVATAVGNMMSELGQELEVLSSHIHKQPEYTEVLGVDWPALDRKVGVCSLQLTLKSTGRVPV